MTLSRPFVEMPLVGTVIEDFQGHKLPSKRDVLRNLLFHVRDGKSKVTLRKAANDTYEKLLLFWEKGGLPTKPKYHAITAIEKLYDAWRKVRKNENDRSKSQIAREKVFQANINDWLFDIAHQNVMSKPNVLEEDKKFLEMQRKPKRPGFMTKLDVGFAERQAARAARKSVAENRAVSALKRSARGDISTASLSSSSSDTDGAKKQSGESSGDAYVPPTREHLKRRVKKKPISTNLAAALDSTGQSDRQATRVLQQAAKYVLGEDSLETHSLSRSSLRRQRVKARVAVVSQLKEEAKKTSGPILVHWDGKLVEEGDKKVERCPVIASTLEGPQLLKIPKLESGTGRAQADAVVDALDSWHLRDRARARALSFDTTSSNTGPFQGACVWIETLLGRDLLHLSCRHHVAELSIKAVYEFAMGSSPAPQEEIFSNLQKEWDGLDLKNYKTGAQDRLVMRFVRPEKEKSVQFARDHLKNCLPRDDYQEFLQLELISLGEIPPGGVRFKKPGAHSKAR